MLEAIGQLEELFIVLLNSFTRALFGSLQTRVDLFMILHLGVALTKCLF